MWNGQRFRVIPEFHMCQADGLIDIKKNTVIFIWVGNLILAIFPMDSRIISMMLTSCRKLQKQWGWLAGNVWNEFSSGTLKAISRKSGKEALTETSSRRMDPIYLTLRFWLPTTKESFFRMQTILFSLVSKEMDLSRGLTMAARQVTSQ